MKFIYIFFLFLYLLFPFLPSFGAIDQIGFQWLYLSVSNVLFFICYLFSSKFSFKLNINKSFLAFIIFILLSSLSVFTILNTAEYLIELSRLLILLSSFIIFIIILSHFKFSFFEFSIGVLFFLFLELLFFFFVVFWTHLITKNLTLFGFTSNVNIQAFSIVFKIPIVLFALNSFKRFNKFIAYLSLILSVSALFLISSRAAFLSLALIFIFFLINSFKDFFSNFKTVSKVLLPGFLFTYFILNPFLNSGKKFSNLKLINESSLLRLDFYREAFNSIIHNPFFGIGLGHWKLYGIDAHKNLIKGYVIPYHAHNDFLQIGAESGVFSLLSYLLFFIFLFYLISKSNIASVDNYVKSALMMTVIVYIIDASLNFPISRPIIQIQLLLFVSFIYVLLNQSFYSLKFNRTLTFTFILVGLPLIFSSYKVFSSFTMQRDLFLDFNESKFDTPLNLVESIDDDYPNLIYGGLPIKSIKSNYYSDDTLIKNLLDQSIKDNPFIKYPQALKAVRFKILNQLDSALYYAKDAFNGIPNNEFHTATYLSTLTALKDSLTVDSLYPHIKKMQSYNMWKALLLSNLALDRSNSEFTTALFNEASSLYPDDETFALYNLRMSKGDSIIITARSLSNIGNDLYNNGEYLKSAESYLKASKLVPEDPAYLENAGHSYYMANLNNKASVLFDSVINHYSSRSGKAHYLKGLMSYELSLNKVEACKFFNIAIKKGNKDAIKAQKLICK